MGKLRTLSGGDVCRILSGHGFVEVRRRGSHIVMQKKLDGGTITVPIPDHDELREGLSGCALLDPMMAKPGSSKARRGLSRLLAG